ncbi:hypothetical protein SDC9_04306 [bioreactor metagenome]|uniref:HTH tetR-type domain-containing protein n=1 Tax=bioreactor metagenome TaxID=1076179 RepID=A0A644SVX6_9ZZZZ|nr:TetR/AcrR family transcriptional regulator [Negativicutes bacterium]
MTAKRILIVALKHFSAKGYDGTSLAEIAGDVGIKKPSIYAHYKSKHDLFLAVVEEVAEDYRNYRQQVLLDTKTMNFEQRLYCIFESMIIYFLQDRSKMAFWVRVWMFPPVELRDTILMPWKNLNTVFVSIIENIFQEGIAKGEVRDGNARDMANTYLCLLDGIITRVILTDDDHYINMLPQVWQCFWAGAKA